MLSESPVPLAAESPALCRRCGAPLPGGWASSSCPRCLVHFSVEEVDPTRVFPHGTEETSLGDYELLNEIARGGMGVVYRARQQRLGRIVAVKVLAAGEFASTAARERFRAEASAAARLQHPGIVAIHDVGEADGLPWFSMELVAGENLASLVREQPLPARQAAEYVRAIADALQHAHEHGVLHRDLKPSNILLDPESGPRITDFGIARCGETADLTRTGEVLGSPGYTAPEQAFGGNADARTDVYGLGAILYHLLTARPPFQGPTLDAIVLQLREADPLAPRRLNPAVPRDLETICLRCLRKEPAQRYATAREVAEELRRFLAGEMIHARPISPIERAVRWARRRPAIAALLALVNLLVGVVLVGALAVARQQARMERRGSLLAEARTQRAEAMAGSRTLALEALREAWVIAPSEELLAEAIACLGLHEMTHERTVPPGDSEAVPPALGGSADGAFELRFAEGTLSVIERATGTERARFSNLKSQPIAQLDNTGRRIALVRVGEGVDPRNVEIFEVGRAEPTHTLVHSQAVSCLDWSGELLAVGGGTDRLIHIWETSTGQRLRRFSGHDSEVETLRFRPDGQEFVSFSRDGVVHMWHAARGVEVLRLEGHVNHIGPAWWANDGVRLYCPREDGKGVDVFRCDWSRTQRVLAPGQDEPRSENVPSLVLDATGELAAAIDETACRVWSLAHGHLVATFPKDRAEWMTGVFGDEASLWLSGWNRALRRIPIDRTRAGWPRFGEAEPASQQPGPLLVAARRGGNAFALTANNDGVAHDSVGVYLRDEQRWLALPQADPFSAALSPDGRYAVTGSFSQSGAALWKLPKGGEPMRLAYPGLVLGCAFANGGKTLWLWGSHGVHRFETDGWQSRQFQTAEFNQGFAVSEDGRFAATLTRNEAVLHRAEDLRVLARFPVPLMAGGGGSASIAFSADGNRLALHAAPGTILAWHLPTLREELRRLGMDW